MSPGTPVFRISPTRAWRLFWDHQYIGLCLPGNRNFIHAIAWRFWWKRTNRNFRAFTCQKLIQRLFEDTFREPGPTIFFLAVTPLFVFFFFNKVKFTFETRLDKHGYLLEIAPAELAERINCPAICRPTKFLSIFSSSFIVLTAKLRSLSWSSSLFIAFLFCNLDFAISIFITIPDVYYLCKTLFDAG